ncbi:hypothetical protein EDB86DRAFT_3126959 [Lactarius hatsudake]|nr:hypothetical protein EDB86DRAFT_3126959 [Lactarius hatsudake]
MAMVIFYPSRVVPKAQGFWGGSGTINLFVTVTVIVIRARVIWGGCSEVAVIIRGECEELPRPRFRTAAGPLLPVRAQRRRANEGPHGDGNRRHVPFTLCAPPPCRHRRRCQGCAWQEGGWSVAECSPSQPMSSSSLGCTQQGTIASDVTVVTGDSHGTGVWGVSQPVTSSSGAAGNRVDRWSHHRQQRSCHADAGRSVSDRKKGENAPIALKLGTDSASTGMPGVIGNNLIALILENARLDVASVSGLPLRTEYNIEDTTWEPVLRVSARESARNIRRSFHLTQLQRSSLHLEKRLVRQKIEEHEISLQALKERMADIENDIASTTYAVGTLHCYMDQNGIPIPDMAEHVAASIVFSEDEDAGDSQDGDASDLQNGDASDSQDQTLEDAATSKTVRRRPARRTTRSDSIVLGKIDLQARVSTHLRQPELEGHSS